MSPWLDFALFSVLAVTAVGIVVLRHLFAVVMLGGVFSLVASSLFVVMDAPDVAFTEAAVGAGVVTVLLLGAIALTTRREKPATEGVAIPLAVCIITGVVLIYGTLDLPHFGAPDAPVHVHVAPDYLIHREPEVDVPNVVNAVLASYRGFDTLGEVVVVFAAGVGVLLLIGQHYVGRQPEEDEENEESDENGDRHS